mmetsp:Transcript_44886/g.73128  ORF Transcript_44886/g.73128 Transcript_44886/m.73128 type:complete len:117 (-) Transcript_44886:247-597(-)
MSVSPESKSCQQLPGPGYVLPYKFQNNDVFNRDQKRRLRSRRVCAEKRQAGVVEYKMWNETSEQECFERLYSTTPDLDATSPTVTRGPNSSTAFKSFLERNKSPTDSGTEQTTENL